jgi:hypothetical protein
MTSERTKKERSQNGHKKLVQTFRGHTKDGKKRTNYRGSVSLLVEE